MFVNLIRATTYHSTAAQPHLYATHYSGACPERRRRDFHGNVDRLHQQLTTLAPASQQIKTIAYEYDLVSGNVHEVKYQEGYTDQQYHRYAYDADNRITDVYTSTDGVIWDHDANYRYYRHGPLARMELGEHLVQGVDYAYTLHGWIKGVNSNVLSPTHDIGQDGATGNGYHSQQPGAHSVVARDAFGYSLSYYQGDYKPINGRHTGGSYFLANQQHSTFGQSVPDLYNGNIARMTTSLTDTANQALPIHGYAYRYDQLNRLNHMQAHTGITGNSWPASNTRLTTYGVDTIAFDANGNILQLQRTAHQTANPTMDNLTYHYQPGTNQLSYVDDAIAAALYDNDVDDQAAGNYSYDEIGNLVADQSAEIAQINWMVNGKIRSIIRTAGSTQANLYFEYGPDGQRVRKIVQTPTGGDTTWYVRDVQGNVMATYKQRNDSIFVQEKYLYGSSRLGSSAQWTYVSSLTPPADTNRYTRVLGHKQYELSNHLGNVLVTVTDHKTPVATSGTITHWQPTVRSYTDYYPFGMEMGERSGREGAYRYSFQAQETDGEVYGPGNAVSYKYRIHDARIGRFFSVDPLYREYPWNSTYAFSENRLIDGVELEGLEWERTAGSLESFRLFQQSQGHKTTNDEVYVAVGISAVGVLSVSSLIYGSKAVAIWLGVEATETIAEELSGIPIIPLAPDPTDLADPLINKTIREAVSPSRFKITPDMSMAQKKAVRQDLASEYLPNSGHTRYVDPSLPVYTRNIEAGTEFVQYRIVGSEETVGNYYAPLGTSPDQIGLNPADVVASYKVTVNIATEGLYSTHVKNAELYYDASRRSTGGGTQIYSESLKDNATFTPLE